MFARTEGLRTHARVASHTQDIAGALGRGGGGGGGGKQRYEHQAHALD